MAVRSLFSGLYILQKEQFLIPSTFHCRRNPGFFPLFAACKSAYYLQNGINEQRNWTWGEPVIATACPGGGNVVIDSMLKA